METIITTARQFGKSRRARIAEALTRAASKAKNMDVKTILLDKARAANYWPAEFLTAKPAHTPCDFTPDDSDLFEPRHKPRSLLPVILVFVALTIIQLIWF